MIRKIYYTPLLVLCLSACTKWYELDKGISDFSVTAEKNAYKVGEDVKFVFNGDANIIDFYSGEFLHDYEYHEERITSASGAVNFSFRSNVSGGTQPDQLTVHASTNFSGDYEDFSKLESAQWTDITSRFLLGTSATFRASGVQDISDLIGSPDPNKPLFLAFRYKTYPQAEHGTARTWGIQTSLVECQTSFGVFVGNMTKIGYRIMEKYPNAPSRSTTSATALSLRGNTPDFDNQPFTDTWAVRLPIPGR